MIDFNEIKNIVATQLMALIDNNQDLYAGYSFIIENEQQFEKDKKKNTSKTIYVVLHYLEATINYGQTILPFTINILGEQNSTEVAQKLFLDYALTYNLKQNDDLTIQQFYSSPTIMNNFEEVYSGFRSLMYLSASFRIVENSLNLKSIKYKKDDGTYYEIPKLSAIINGNIQVDSQAFFSSKSLALSKPKIKALTLSITSYLYNEEFYNKILKLMLGIEEDNLNNEFTLNIEYTNGIILNDVKFVYVDATTQNKIGELDSISITFTRGD